MQSCHPGPSTEVGGRLSPSVNEAYLLILKLYSERQASDVTHIQGPTEMLSKNRGWQMLSSPSPSLQVSPQKEPVHFFGTLNFVAATLGLPLDGLTGGQRAYIHRSHSPVISGGRVLNWLHPGPSLDTAA